ncbi:hemolysin family protein [Actinoallomurus bryophytorum]|uniref:Putative hemolysin n=1 Tax=Actinoallomurus bryophytorum TaxID=1490222 RepID=A0A543CM79_9ACTN|nr:hemolysin family protein [Actinoallomurus bryophytorum]TQL98213.1 putative hemolysin [Actinoallomurus bryophytorum]
MTGTLASAAIVLALIVIEALFVASELALVSLRDSQVRRLAERGRRGAAVAKLVSDPNRFLAVVQIGVTLTALLSSAYGAVTLSGTAKDALVKHAGMSDGLAGFVGVVGVTLIISYVTLVIGELAPKRLALQNAEGVAVLVGPFLDRMAIIARPVIWLLSKSTNIVVRTLGGDPNTSREAITAEEVRALVAGNTEIAPDERDLIEEVFAAGERQLREVLVPRTEVEFLDESTPLFKAAQIAAGSPHSRYPVYRESHDDVVGFVHVRDLLDPAQSGLSTPVGDVIRPVLYLPASKRVLAVLSEMRREGHHLAIVVDEYGGTAGIVTLEDLVEELIGDIRDEYDVEDAQARRLHGGALEIDGLLNLDDFADETGVELPEGPYETVGGYLMAVLGHLPQVGEMTMVGGHRLSVTEVDGRRVARVRVTPPPVPEPEHDES